MLSFIYFSLYLESTKKSTSRKVDDGAMVKFIDELYVYQILSIEWYFWLLQCNGNESQYLPNYLSLWNSVYTTWWKLVQKVKRQNKYQKAKTLHLQSIFQCIFQSFLHVYRGRVYSISRSRWNGFTIPGWQRPNEWISDTSAVFFTTRNQTHRRYVFKTYLSKIENIW